MKIKNPTGRVDWLAGKLLEVAIEKHQNPLASAIYQEIKEPLQQVFRKHLGPRNRKMRELKRWIEGGNRILQARRVA